MGFLTDLVARQVRDDDWKLVEPLVYQGRTETFTVAKESETDFASVPLIFRWLIPRSGRHTKAAVLHDDLWRAKRCSYQDADAIFRRALHELDVPLLRRWIMWAAVRWASLFRSGFRDGPGDLPLVFLVTIFPGLFVTVGGLVILPFFLVFAAFELAAGGVVSLLRTLGLRNRIKTFRPPAVVAHSRPSRKNESADP